MKKIPLIILSLTIISLTGCYDANSAKVRINLGNMPLAHNTQKSFIDRVLGLFEKNAYAVPAGVYKVHIAAYSDNSAIATASVAAGDVKYQSTAAGGYDYVEIEVPAGKNITILVIGETAGVTNPSSLAEYFGVNTVNLAAGETAEVTVTASIISSISSIIQFDTDTKNNNPLKLHWNSIGVKTRFKVYNYNGELVYEGYDTSFTLPDKMYCGESFNLEFEFEDFGLKTERIVSQNYVNYKCY